MAEDIDDQELDFVDESEAAQQAATIATLEAQIAAMPKYIYTEVADTTGKNPSTEGWYEKDGDNYVASTDTEPAAGKTYYVRSVG